MLRRLLSNRFIRVLLPFTVAALIFFPALLPFVLGISLGGYLSLAGVRGLSDVARRAWKTVKSNRNFLRSDDAVSEDNGEMLSESSVKRSARVTDISNPVARALVSHLNKMGLVVNTDWEYSKKVLSGLDDRYEKMKNNPDKIKGFVWGGVIHINPNLISSETFVHEYTHIWVEALRQKNPEEWKHIVEMMKEDERLWNEVKEEYVHLESDDDIADEVLAQFSGRRGYERLSQYCKDGESPERAFKGVLRALEKFWKNVAELFDIHYESRDDLADRILYDFLRGVNPEKFIERSKQSERKTSFSVDEIETEENNQQYRNNGMVEEGNSQRYNGLKANLGKAVNQLIASRQFNPIQLDLFPDNNESDMSIVSHRDLDTDEVFIQNHSDEERMSLRYQEGEAYVEYMKRNHIPVSDRDRLLYMHDKYTDAQWNVIDSIFKAGFTKENASEVGKRIATLSFVTSKQEAFDILVLNKTISPETVLPYYDGVTEHFRSVNNDMSPLLKQFFDLKEKHPSALLLFRTGDFYESYEEDAEKASKILGITLTKSTKQKGPDGNAVKMAGFPYHALDTYLPKLIRAGERVAICDQLEAPKQTVKRSITEMVVPQSNLRMMIVGPSSFINQNYHIIEDGLFVYVDARNGFGLSAELVNQVAGVYYGSPSERDGRLMYGFPTRDDATNFVHQIGILNERYTDSLRDGLIEKMKAAGIDVSTDWQEGERVLAQENGRVRYSNDRDVVSPELRVINDSFNSMLSVLTPENANNLAFQLGIPNSLMKDGGVQDKPLKLYGNKIIAKQRKHGFGFEELRNLPIAVANPIAIFNNYKNENNRSILTELRTKNGNFLVSVEVGEDADIDFNIVSSVFGKGDINIVDWLKKGYATYINNEKVQNFLLHHSALIAGASAKSEPLSAAKIKENFELSKLLGEKIYIRTKNFRNWFGNWEKDEHPSSKIVSDNGEPMVFYHGTNRDFSEFDPEKSAGMMMFTSDENLARKFAAQRYKFDREGNLIKDENGEPVKGDIVMPVYLNVRNPKVIDMDGYDWFGRGVGENTGKDINKGRKHNFSYLEAKQAQREGHDGLILKNVSDSGVKSDHVIVFNANQIKSVYNIGTYRQDSNNIYEHRVSGHTTDDRTADIRYMLVPDSHSPIFISNALLALNKIKQDKATPEQWLKMLEKNGGIKAGEDRWTGLTEWLRSKNDIKEGQLKLILNSNPHDDSIGFEHTWIRQKEDIKTFEESFGEDYDIHEGQAPDYTVEMISSALKSEKITVYSSHPIEDGAFVTPSKMEAQSYAGGGQVYSKEINLKDVAWIDPMQGQYAPVKGPVLTKSEIAAYIKENMIEVEEVSYVEGVGEIMKEDVQTSVEFSDFVSSLTEFDENDNAYIDIKKFNQLSKENDDVYQGFRVDYWGEALEVDDPLAAARFLGIVKEREVNETRLKYTSDGLTNNREIALVVPSIDGWAQDDEIHFGDAGDGRAVAWVRFGETRIPNDVNEKHYEKVLVIDEVQSNRHQEGREKGYIDVKEESRLNDAYHQAEGAVIDYRKFLHEKYPEMGDIARLKDFGTPEEYAREMELTRRSIDSMRALVAYRTNGRIPDAPFEKNWQELCMKRMLRYAAENGYDRVAWTTGAQQADRYSLGGVVSNIQSYVNDDGSRHIMVNYVDERMLVFDIDGNGKILSTSGHTQGIVKVGQPLHEVFGKVLSQKLANGEGEIGHNKFVTDREVRELSGDNLRLGGDGMITFYDDILVRFTDKYTKQWGVKSEDVFLAGLGKEGLTMHSVSVSPQMKHDIMEGQPMFFRNGEHQAYGFVHDGTIYIDPRIATAETPIHEYTHLWAEVLRQRNPQEWQNIVQMMKDTPEIWNYVKQSYPHLRTDDQIADEALAQFSGRRGYQKLQEFANGQDDKSIFDKMEEVLEKFWSNVAEFFGIHYENKEDVADRILYDLLKEVNPLDYKIQDMEGLYESREPQIESKNFKFWFGDWRNPSVHGEVSKVVDDAGYPLVVEHGTHNRFTEFDSSHIGETSGDQGLYGKGFYFGLTAPAWLDDGKEDYHVMRVYLNLRNPKELVSGIKTDIYDYISENFDSPALRGLILSENGKELSVGDYIDAVRDVDNMIKEQPSYIDDIIEEDEELQVYHPKDRLHVWREHEIFVRTGFIIPGSLPYVIGEMIGSEKFSDALQKDGYDGVIVTHYFDDHDYKEFVAFSSDQIRLAEDYELVDAVSENIVGESTEQSSVVSFMNSTALQREVDLLSRQGGKIIVGYENPETAEYVFVGESAKALSPYVDFFGTLHYSDDVTRSTEFHVPVKETDKFESMTKSLIGKGYFFAIVGKERVEKLLRPLAVDVEASISGSVPKVRSAVQLSLFDDAAFVAEPVAETQVRDDGLSGISLHTLSEGEHCYVERRYTETGAFSFVGGEHIETDADVAYIFKKLEDKSVENTFVCMVKDGEPTVIHLSIGDPVACMAPLENALLAYSELKPDKIWFIHNHPSGNLHVSKQDYACQQRMVELFPAAVQPAIIINTVSGKFITFDCDVAYEKKDMPSLGEDEKRDIKVYSFDRNVFSKDWSPGSSFSMSSAWDVAKYVSSHRLGEHNKLSLLVINNQRDLTGNVFLPWTDVKDSLTREGVALISRYVHQMGGVGSILYGTDKAMVESQSKCLASLSEKLKAYNVRLFDVMSISKDLDYYSCLEIGALDPGIVNEEGRWVRDESGEENLTPYASKRSVVKEAAAEEQAVSPETFKPGDIIITLPDSTGARKIGRVDKVDDNLLHYTVSNGYIMVGQSANLESANDWRLASDEEKHAFLDEEKRVLATESGQEQQRRQSQSSVALRRLTLQDREAGGALVDHLRSMGVSVNTDNHENRRVLKTALKDQSEAGKVRYFKTVQGESYGFAYKGEIHLDVRKIDAELPLHEYAHLWCEAMRRINPDNWNGVVQMMKQDAETWNFVKAGYPELSDDSALAEEVIAHYSGKRGAAKLQAELERMTPKDADYGSRWGNIFQNISKAIQDFWRHVGDSLNIRYESKEDLADQILNDFASQVNPVRKVEKWLAERDKEYAAAVESGDADKARNLFWNALTENVGNGITPFMAVDGYRGKLQALCHDVKSEEPSVRFEALSTAVDLMFPLVPENAVLVPAPSHLGRATNMLTLAQLLSQKTGAPVVDILKSNPRESQYFAKKTSGKPLSAEELGIYRVGSLPEGKLPVVIDNVVHSGNTAEACVKALGKGVVLSLASATSQDRHVASLKRLDPVVYDRQGNLIPLSERFEFKNKWLGIPMKYKPLEDMYGQDALSVKVQGLDGYSYEDIELIVEDHVNKVLAEQFPDEDVYIKEVTVIGSRIRGEAHEGSDLDILLEYGGEDVREDTLFNVLHEEPLEIEGIPVDINPINEHYSLDTASWLERDARWREVDFQKNNTNQNDTIMKENEVSQQMQTKQQELLSIDQVQEKAVKLFGNNFVFDFWNETEPGTKIDQIDLGGMPDTITIDKLVIKDGKLSLYSDDLAGDIDLQALDAVDISKVDASLGDIKEYLNAHQKVEDANMRDQIRQQFERVEKLVEELGLSYVPLALSVPVIVEHPDEEIREDWRLADDKAVISHVTFAESGNEVFLTRQDSYDHKNGTSLFSLPLDSEKQVLDQVEKMLNDQDRQITVFVDSPHVPDWALNMIVNGEIGELTDEERIMVEEFEEKYPNHIFSPRDESEGFLPFPAFGPGAECTKVDIVRTATPRQLRMAEQMKKMEAERNNEEQAREKEIEASKPKISDVKDTVKHLLERDDRFRYMLLDRMRSDVNYFLGNGNRHEPDLWAGNAKDHIIIMDALMRSLPEQPQWLSTEQLIDYADQMGVGEVFRGPADVADSLGQEVQDEAAVKEENREKTNEVSEVVFYRCAGGFVVLGDDADTLSEKLSDTSVSVGMKGDGSDTAEKFCYLSQDSFYAMFSQDVDLNMRMAGKDLINQHSATLNSLALYISEKGRIEDKVSESAAKESAAVASPAAQPSGRSKWDNIDYTQYVVPEGVTISNARITRIPPSDAQKYARYSLSADVGDNHYEKIMYSNDLKAYYEKDSAGKRTNRVTLEQLVVKYFGKRFTQGGGAAVRESADAEKKAMSEKSRQNAKELERLDDRLRKERQKDASEDKKVQSPKPLQSVVQSALLLSALDHAFHGELLINEDFKRAPIVINAAKGELSPFNSLMLSLQSEYNGYKSNAYITYNGAMEAGYHVNSGERSITLDRSVGLNYVNRYDGNDIVSAEEYKALSPEEQEMYKVNSETEKLHLFNIDQTSMPESNSALYASMTEERSIPKTRLETYDYIKERCSDDMVFVKDNDNYYTYGDDAEKMVSLIGPDVKGLETVSEGGKDVSVVSYTSEQLTENLGKYSSDVKLNIVDVGDNLLFLSEAEKSQIGDEMDALLSGLSYNDPSIEQEVLVLPHYNAVCDVLSVTCNSKEPNAYKEDLASLASANYRAVSDYLGSEKRLNRTSGMLPFYSIEYNGLVGELSACYMMLHHGVPYRFSDNFSLKEDFWKRELTENHGLVEKLSDDVNTTVAAFRSLINKEQLDYRPWRSENKAEKLSGMQYSITETLSLMVLSGSGNARVAVVRNNANDNVAVILPRGASAGASNEPEGLEKKSIALALRKEGYENISFYNAGGYFGLNVSNDFFRDKTVTLSEFADGKLETVRTLDFSRELDRTHLPEIEQVALVRDENNDRILYVKPTSQQAFAVYPEKSDIDSFCQGVNSSNFDDVRESLGRKYMSFVKRHPDQVVSLVPPVLKNIDVSRISDVVIARDKNNSDRTNIYVTIDGKRDEDGKEVPRYLIERFLLSEDKESFKNRMASFLYSEELGEELKESAAGLSEEGHAQFLGAHRESANDTGVLSADTAAETPEDKEMSQKGRSYS